MLASSLQPQPHYSAFRAPRDSSNSPSCRSAYNNNTTSPLLTPSPLRQRQSSFATSEDAMFLHSPFRSPNPRHDFDDEDGGAFFASPTIQPMRTPLRPTLNTRQLNQESPFSSTRAVLGTKRKPGPAGSPISLLTPLTTTKGESSFDRLAPLPAPLFSGRTPRSTAETDSFLQRQTRTMTRLNIGELGVENMGDVTESEDELGADVRVDLFAAARSSARKAEQDGEEVAEAISPDGRVTKRRARSRPVSAELMECAKSPSLFAPSNASPRVTPLVFPKLDFNQDSPSMTRFRTRQDSLSSHWSPSSSSDMGSPSPRQRSRALHTLTSNAVVRRIPMDRMASTSSATLFFGPAIPVDPKDRTKNRRSLVDTEGNGSKTGFLNNPSGVTQPPTFSNPERHGLPNRHSYAGFGSHPTWLNSPSTSPHKPVRSSTEGAVPQTREDADEDMFFSGASDNSFSFSFDSPDKHGRRPSLPLKFKDSSEDSGVVLSDEERGPSLLEGRRRSARLTLPSASTSVSTIQTQSSGDENMFASGFVTPLEPHAHSGWPTVVGIASDDDDEVDDRSTASRDSQVVDAFIMRALATGAKDTGPKKAPGTPTKKNKTFVGAKRPWQSAVAQKIGLKGFGDDSEDKGKSVKKKAPRKSMPAVFGLSAHAKEKSHVSDDEDDEDELSPSSRKAGTNLYAGLGLGRPSGAKPRHSNQSSVGSVAGRARWLMRRSSSGAFSFSSGSETGSNVGTPIGLKGHNWRLPPPPVPAFSPARAQPAALRSGSNTSTSSGTVTTGLTSPVQRKSRVEQGQPNAAPRTHSRSRSMHPPPRLSTAEERPGKFERDFEVINDLGSGEFGKASKVRYRNSADARVFAIKKSRRFEGMKHRLRLREEVDVLRHLSQAAREEGLGDHHPNVLGYVDSWEEDETLFIQTELCDMGNFAHFLWEYGRVFPRLDEGRVWKILADLSNGLRFIHEHGVLHLDLKPANIFLTGEGRFKIGDFGMATLWPRQGTAQVGFEREGDKVYLAPEVLQGRYGKAADVFSLGVIMLEAACNIVVPDQGEPWQRLRQEDFSQVDLDESPELLGVIKGMMRTDPALRVTARTVWAHPVVARARAAMARTREEARRKGASLFAASPLAGDPEGFLEAILGAGGRRTAEADDGGAAMDVDADA
ncbi:hypothetical protein PUNSTDRAFT_131444 [Punctularia strigosozonata HHB-11173 SS5]|uniref:uncharacterized protein n=1 Tax=Punctularia strigosozonata (strain HHB-11173) TaxID=741275 RepID=UPI000441846E|nr:uncharacterized protein PUNSTDRAFT_131444 [Punctularia strigosozonata HHB-11173 SS5]EIN11277.1 hypothetical protein PUNSTDRAFT_131444 [Punctularia strigosozonata HHB-11173 SS5]